MSIKFIVLSCILLICVGCEDKTVKKTYICTEDQLDIVEKQFQICSQTDYLDSYCYDMARAEHCKEVKDDK